MTTTRQTTIAILLAACGLPAFAQDFTHPAELNLPASGFERPSPADYELALENGLIAFVAPARQVPLVTLSAFIRVGKVSDMKQGSAEVLADALRISGPANMSATAFRQALDSMTAQFSVEMHDEWTEVTLNVPTEDLDQALPLFVQLVREPGISAENIERASRAARPAAADLAGESGPSLYKGTLAAAVEHFYEVIYAGHPYGYAPDREDFENLKVADVQAFHAAWFVPRNTTLAIAGDIDVDDMHGALTRSFDDWPDKTAPIIAPLPEASRTKAAQHNYPVDKLQSWLVFGHALPQVPLEDQAALEVMNYILAGGHLWTRMTVETRYRYGYTNDASGFPEDRWYGPGGYSFRSYSRPEVIRPLFDNMMREVRRIREEPVSEEELFIASGALTDGSFQVRYLDGYKLTRTFALERLRYGNHDRSATYVRRIRSVTREDVLAAAKKYLHPDEMQVILVGRIEPLLR